MTFADRIQSFWRQITAFFFPKSRALFGQAKRREWVIFLGTPIIGDHPGAICCTNHTGDGGHQGYHLPPPIIPNTDTPCRAGDWNFHISHWQSDLVELVKLVELPYLTWGTYVSYADRDTLQNWRNFHILHSQRHPEELVELLELPYLTLTETTCGTSISHTDRDTLWNGWNFHISHSQRYPMELV